MKLLKKLKKNKNKCKKSNNQKKFILKNSILLQLLRNKK